MTNPTRRALSTLLIATAALMAPAAASAQVSIARGDGVCPPGQRPMSHAEVQAQRAQVCEQLGEWHIARLADGGSMDGPGYGCGIRPADGRALGHTVCTPRRAAPRPQIIIQSALPQTVPIRFVGVHPHWRDEVLFAPDGTYRRGSGDAGRWSIEGTTLVLRWNRWDAERLVLQPDGSFRAPSNGFTLTVAPRQLVTPPPVFPRPVQPLRPAFAPRHVVGSYQGVHPRWQDTVQLYRDGRYSRGNGDPGQWHIEGSTLMLDWDNWGVARLTLQPDGSFRGPDGFTLSPIETRRPRRFQRRRALRRAAIHPGFRHVGWRR